MVESMDGWRGGRKHKVVEHLIVSIDILEIPIGNTLKDKGVLLYADMYLHENLSKYERIIVAMDMDDYLEVLIEKKKLKNPKKLYLSFNVQGDFDKILRKVEKKRKAFTPLQLYSLKGCVLVCHEDIVIEQYRIIREF